MRKKLKLMFVLSSSAVIFATGATTNAQGIGDRNHAQGLGGYRVSGKVYLPDGRPAVNVTVSVNGTETSNATSRTNQDGAYEITGLGAGNYAVSVRESGYKVENESITIAGGSAGSAFTVIFHLSVVGEAKAANPLLASVPSAAVAKFQKGMEKVASDPKIAVSLFDDAITSYPNFAAAYFEKGAALLKMNDSDKALECFVKAIQLKPDYIEAKYSYGYVEYLKKNYEVAAAVFDDVLKQKNDMPEAHMYLGISLYYLKNVGAAEAQLKMATAAESGERVALAHRFLGGIYAAKKQNAAAAAELQKYVDLVPKAPDADKLKATIADLKKQG